MSTYDVAGILRQNAAVFVIDGKTYNISDSHKKWDEVIAAHVAEDKDALLELLDIQKAVAKYTEGDSSIRIDDGIVTWNGEVFDNALTRRMIVLVESKMPIAPLTRFMDNLMENPSATSIEELFLFLDANDLPITPDGHFLAYKKIREDYTDIYTGRFDNSVGTNPSMRRGAVDDNRGNTCSKGLHFCSKSYLAHFGSYGKTDRVVTVKINPRDVVSIPKDYGNAKGRACTYEVVGEWTDYHKAAKDDDPLAADLEYQQQISVAGAPVHKQLDGRWKDKDHLWTLSPEEFGKGAIELKAHREQEATKKRIKQLGLSITEKFMVKDFDKNVYQGADKADAVKWMQSAYNLSDAVTELLS